MSKKALELDDIIIFIEHLPFVQFKNIAKRYLIAQYKDFSSELKINHYYV
ncbi:hypothetical protein [Ligilactobacillus faecis]|nr:hypothetical protein [Ligilactobacillus faecis]WGN88631.1 hypothetical protein QFX10_05970 [Ligilactobacillus faecis]